MNRVGAEEKKSGRQGREGATDWALVISRYLGNHSIAKENRGSRPYVSYTGEALAANLACPDRGLLTMTTLFYEKI